MRQLIARCSTLLVLVFLGTSAFNAARAELLLDFTGGNPNSFIGGPATSGWEFSVSTPVLASGLGYFDIGADGFAQSHPVGLWTSSGVLLTSITVTSASPIVASASTDGDWRFAAIAPILLAPGNYVVGGEFFAPDTDGVIFDASALILAPGVAFVEDRSGGAGSGFSFPTNTSPFTGNSFFGPSILLASPVPEPSSLALLAIALFSIAVARCTRRDLPIGPGHLRR